MDLPYTGNCPKSEAGYCHHKLKQLLPLLISRLKNFLFMVYPCFRWAGKIQVSYPERQTSFPYTTPRIGKTNNFGPSFYKSTDQKKSPTKRQRPYGRIR